MRTFVLVAAILALVPLAAPADDVEARVKALIADLASDDAETRDKASAALAELGDAAEPALVAALQHGDPEVRARAEDALSSIRLERRIGPSAWIQLPEKETPLAEAYADLARQAKRKIEVGAIDLAGKALPGGLGRVPFWQALDRMSLAAGASYTPFEGDTIVLQPVPLSAIPRSYQGPFRATISEITVTRTGDLAAGTVNVDTELQLLLEWESNAQPHGIAPAARVEAALDDKGGSMIVAGATEMDVPVEKPDGDQERSHSIWLSLGGASAGATKIATLKGAIDVHFLLEEQDASFDAGERAKGATKDAGPVHVQVSNWAQAGDQGSATITVRGLQEIARSSGLADANGMGEMLGLVRFSLRDKDGKQLEAGNVAGTTSVGGEDKCHFDVSFDAVPAGDVRLCVSVVTRTLSRPVKFEFHDVPLP